jgi:hypothetical protein
VNDTPPAVEARMNALFAARSGSDRVRMACEMFTLARALMVARIREETPDISDTELRVRVFERTYGDDLAADARARVIARLRG